MDALDPPRPDEDLPRLKRRDRPRPVRVALRVSYDGAPFHGFQRQPDRPTVEGALMDALVAAGLGPGLSFASRTDAGVHAEGQVVCVRAAEGTEPDALARTLNERLPAAIRIEHAVVAPPKFHPRWTATGKRYRYRLATGSASRPRHWSHGLTIEIGRLRAIASGLLAAPSISGFTAAGAPARAAPPLTRLEVIEADGAVELLFEGPAFGRYAIRHMVGSLVAEAAGVLADGGTQVRAARTSPYVGPRAPAHGLVLEAVYYPGGLDPFADAQR